MLVKPSVSAIATVLGMPATSEMEEEAPIDALWHYRTIQAAYSGHDTNCGAKTPNFTSEHCQSAVRLKAPGKACTSSSMADEEKHQLIRSLKREFDAKQSQLRNVEQQRRTVEAQLRRAAYTAAQLDELPDSVQTYRAVGKAYFLLPKASIMGHLEEAVKGSDGELKKLSGSREALAKSADGLRGELNELISSLRRG